MVVTFFGGPMDGRTEVLGGLRRELFFVVPREVYDAAADDPVSTLTMNRYVYARTKRFARDGSHIYEYQGVAS